MNLFGAVNNKLFNFKNDDYLLEKGGHIFVSDRVVEPIALRFSDISCDFSELPRLSDQNRNTD